MKKYLNKCGKIYACILPSRIFWTKYIWTSKQILFIRKIPKIWGFFLQISDHFTHSNFFFSGSQGDTKVYPLTSEYLFWIFSLKCLERLKNRIPEKNWFSIFPKKIEKFRLLKYIFCSDFDDFFVGDFLVNDMQDPQSKVNTSFFIIFS